MTWSSQLKKLIPETTLISSAALAVAGRGATIFMFHRVLRSSEACYDAEMVTSADLFHDFMQWLSQEYDIVPLAEITTRLRSGRPLRRLCSLTFDDGWMDNYTTAFPLLRQFGVSATIFLASAFIGTTRRLWQEKLWYLLRSVPMDSFSEFVQNWQAQNEIVDYAPATSNFTAWRKFLMRLASQRAEDFVANLQAITPAKAVPPEPVFMNWDQVREMRQAEIEFGAHTVNHVLLPAAEAVAVQAEIEQSRSEIERQINHRIAGFAYPWGALTPAVRESVSRAGFEYAAGVQPGLVRPKSDPFLLPRIAISDSVLRYGNTFSSTHTAVYVAVKSLSRGTSEY